MGTRPAAAQATELERRLNEARAGGRRLFVPYLTAGLPSPQRFVDLLSELATCADAIEVGIPFSDPVMDGPVITAASTRALEAGIGVDRCFDLIRDARRYAGVPIVAMTYYNPVHRMGVDAFTEALHQAGASGMIVPDLPFEESAALRAEVAQRGMALVQMIAPTTPLERAAVLSRGSSGFVYAVSRLGVTGEQATLSGAALAVVVRIRPHTRLPVLLGIGISNGEQAAGAARVADGVIVGSAIMKRVLNGEPDGAAGLAREIRRALDTKSIKKEDGLGGLG
ncbi:MAG TPA: tryptophan synthase subunit alpha [Actinomycetota bacterium]|nr:tryptophan synthase subunit alpha [Actinomycetota bacterium]